MTSKPQLEAPTYPPVQVMTLADFNRDYPHMGQRPEYRLVCEACKFEHAGTVSARNRPPWILVTWVCHSCAGDPMQFDLKRPELSVSSNAPTQERPLRAFFDADELDEMYRDCQSYEADQAKDNLEFWQEQSWMQKETE